MFILFSDIRKMVDISKLGDGITPILEKGKQIPCIITVEHYKLFFYWFLLPLLLLFSIILLIKYRKIFIDKFLKFIGKRGYIRIFMILNNKKMRMKYVKLDMFNNFKIGKRKYTLEKLQDFIIAYDKNNFPIFLFDINFILPLTITKKKINAEIKKQLGYYEKDEINAISMKLDTSILYTVYDKKLISDLYSISGSDDMKKKLFWAVIIIVGLVILYYTGLLEIIMNFLGVDISQSPTTVKP